MQAMNETSLVTQLNLLADQQKKSEQGFRAQHNELHQRRQKTEQKLLALQQELDTIIQEQQALPVAIQRQEQLFVDKEIELLSGALGAAHTHISRGLHNKEERQSLDMQFNLLLEKHPGFGEKWKNYCEFEENRDHYFAMLPAFLHADLLESTAKLARELAPLLNLEQARKKLSEPQHATLTCLYLYDQDNAELALVLPFRVAEVKSGETQIWAQWANFATQAFFAVGKEPTWELVGTEPKEWATYLALHTLAEYSGTALAVQDLARLLQSYTDSHGEDSSIKVTWQLVPLSAAAWQARASEFSTPAEIVESESAGEEANEGNDPVGAHTEQVRPGGEAHVEPSIEPAIEAEAELSIEVEPGCWYSAADLTSWQRPLKTSNDSKWSRSGRQLRTLLTRMVAKGLVETNYVSTNQLWAGLPASHATAMKAHLIRLIKCELLLMQQSTSGGNEVTLNSALLEETQNLINRTVTPFWEEMVVD